MLQYDLSKDAEQFEKAFTHALLRSKILSALQDYTPGGMLQPVVAGMMLDELQRLEAQHSQATAAVGAGRGLGRTAGDWRRRQRILSAIAPIIIAGLTLTQYGLPGYAEFDPADRARPADEVRT